MRLNLKDLLGFGVVTGTVVALALHAEDGHQQSHAPINAANTGTSEAAQVSVGTEGTTLALVGFHVLDGDRALRDQTVVIQAGQLLDVGPVGSIEVPAKAYAVRAHGDEWIVSPGSSTSDFRPLRPGSMADLLVLAADPRRDPEVISRPLGLVDAGVWAATDRRAPEASAVGGSR